MGTAGMDRREKPKKRKSLDNGRAHPSIIPTRVFMAAGLAYTISNPISMRPIGKTLLCPVGPVDDLFSFVQL